jgi:predicted ATPase
MRFTLQAEALLQDGQLEQAIKQVKIIEDFIEETGERFYQAETLRVKGEMLLIQSPDNAKNAETCFKQAIQVAKHQEAKTLELRAAMSLAHLWQVQGRAGDAHKMLAEVYDWFTEGFDTPDLKDAYVLLQALNV